MKRIAVVIPVRKGDSPEVTIRSLARQTVQDFDVMVAWDDEQGPNHARNRGAELTRAEMLLFSDADIEWAPDAVERLLLALDEHPEASWSYGSYEMAGRIQCDRAFSVERLRRGSYISSMSMVRAARYPGWDEGIHRLCDWAFHLEMVEKGCSGVYVGAPVLFRTAERDGITRNGPVSHEQARAQVMAKYNL